MQPRTDLQSIANMSAMPTNLSLGGPSVALAAKQLAQLAPLYATPIRFFGIVRDQHGNPIKGAKIESHINDNPMSEGSQLHKFSDQNGRFEIQGVTGLALSVQVAKAGYYRVSSTKGIPPSFGGFAYALNQGNGLHHPDTENPVVFTLYKPGVLENLVYQKEHSPRIPKDGRSVKLPLDPTTDSIHFVEVQCWTNDSDRDTEGRFDWRFRVIVPSGGLIERDDEFQFEAPIEGYRSSFDFEMTKSKELGWTDSLEREFFVKFSDNIYGRLHIDMGAFGAHYVNYHSFLNPKPGSRNLETDPSKK